MTRRRDFSSTLLSLSSRMVLGIILVVLGIGMLVGASAIALKAHSGELAEHGRTAALLVTTGKILGLLAGTLVFLQFALGAKLKALDRVFDLNHLLLAHRVLGILTAIFASLHPLFVFAPKAKEIGAFRMAVIPELLGAVVLLGLWMGVSAAVWREFLHIPYHLWYRLHRLGMFSAVVLVTMHMLIVTDDFHGDWPMSALAAALGLYAALFVWVQMIKPRFLKRRMYTVTGVATAGRDTFAVELSPRANGVLSYAPGQFAFVTFHSDALPRERHPWTISSTPTRPENLIFTIKRSGDFTDSIGRVKSGDRAMVDGPYGHFSYLAYIRGPKEELVMVAGGVGVTPMLSMLRYMADSGEARKVTLIWSNRNEADILCRDEFEAFKAKLPEFSIHHVLTRQRDFQGRTGRLDASILEELLSGYRRDAAVFVCGPPPMMDAVCTALKQIGFTARHIHTEKFSF